MYCLTRSWFIQALGILGLWLVFISGPCNAQAEDESHVSSVSQQIYKLDLSLIPQEKRDQVEVFLKRNHIWPDALDDVIIQADEFGQSESFVYLIKVNSRATVPNKSENKTYILRLIAKDYHTASYVRKEIEISKRMGELGISPKVIDVNVEQGFYLREFAPGRYIKIEEMQNPEILKKMALKLKKVHEMSVEGLGLNPTQIIKENDVEQIKTFLKHYESNLFPPLDKILVIEQEVDKKSQNSSLIHKDIHPGNIIYDSDSGNIMLIDWELASLADPYYDIAALLIRFKLSDALQEIFLEAYLGRSANIEERIYLSQYKALYCYSRLSMALLRLEKLLPNQDIKPYLKQIQQSYLTFQSESSEQDLFAALPDPNSKIVQDKVKTTAIYLILMMRNYEQYQELLDYLYEDGDT